MSSRRYGDPKRRKSTKEKGHDRLQNSCQRSSWAQTRAKVSKKRERRAGEKNIPIIRVIAKSFAPSFESLAKWLRNSPACEQPCNFSLTCEILLFLTHASFHMRKVPRCKNCSAVRQEFAQTSRAARPCTGTTCMARYAAGHGERP